MRTLIRRLLGVGALLAAACAAIVLARAARFGSRQPRAAVVSPPRIDTAAAVSRLALVLGYKTISGGAERSGNADTDSIPFAEMAKRLESLYPKVHSRLTRESFRFHSLLYRWLGSDPSLPPVVLMAHMDVVPTEDDWTHPPFEGAVGDGYVWGRGALDDKVAVMGILESVETLVGEGFTPKRTIYLAFGGDEEVGGAGAKAISDTLRARGVRPFLVLDEGGAVLHGIMPGVSAPVAVIGIGEKGYVSVVLTAHGHEGHSSQPPRETAVGILARSITRLEDHPFPARIDGVTASMFEWVGPEMPFGQRVVFANLWLFRPLVLRKLTASPSTNATIRTTIAPTMLSASVKDNVLPAEARAVVNFRVLPGERIDGVLRHVRESIDDARVDVAQMKGTLGSEPSPVSSVTSPAFSMLATTIRETMPGVVVAPYLGVAGTDARYYAGMSDNVYRFSAIDLDARELARIHGKDERVSIASYARSISFLRRLITNSSGLEAK